MLSVEVTGAKDLERLFGQLADSLKPVDLEADLLVAVQPMVAAARENVVLGPPSIHLRDNIGAAPVPGEPGRVAVGAFGVEKIGEVFYGRFLEFGSVKQSATPWLRPAFDSTEGSVISRLASRIKARVLSAVGR